MQQTVTNLEAQYGSQPDTDKLQGGGIADSTIHHAPASGVSPVREPFNRPPRIWTLPPQGTVVIPAPPIKAPLPEKPGMTSILLPLVMISVLLGTNVALNPKNFMQQLTFLLPMALFTLMMPMMNLMEIHKKNKAARRKWPESDKKYRKVLTGLHTQLTQKKEEQQRIALLTDPDPSCLEERIRERSRLWERRPEDPDFLSVRVGKGQRPFSATLQIPPLDANDSFLAEVEQFKEDFTSVQDMPRSISLTKVKSLGITGRRQEVAALVRGLVCQIATHHAPSDVRIFCIYPISEKHDWEWMRDLPHTGRLRTATQERLLAAGQDEAHQLLKNLLEELSQRVSKNAEKNEGEYRQPLPHLVVIIHDDVEVGRHPAITHALKLGERLGISMIYLVAEQQAIPSECQGVLRLSDKGHIIYAAVGFAGEQFKDVIADTVDLQTAHRLALALSPLQQVRDGEDQVNLPANVRLLDLLGLPYTDQLDVERWWGIGEASSDLSPRFGHLRVPIGQGANGPIWLDLTENAHGPHGIIAGTTGSGKSELLQSLIAGLAITHHPHVVNFVLVDFKGGAAFKAFEKIPHTVGMVTDLSGRLTERALVALKSELRRREHILGNANVKKIDEYQAMHAQGKNPEALEPLPHLLIVIDEFAELAKEHPTFMNGLVSVVQKGRSLGVHLILATQKPTGVVNANIWSNLKFRICLRVASVQDSRDMLASAEAALLPSTLPGRAYFQIGSEIFELFQSARTSMPARVLDETAWESKRDGAGKISDLQMLMDALVPYQATLGRELFRPWPDPLPHRVILSDVYRRVGPLARAQSAQYQPPFGWLTFPMGLVDRPVEQLQEPWMLDMARKGGHILVAGASGSGKSVFLRTMITALVKTHSPLQLHLYLIDFGGQALRVFEKMPHVGGIFGEADDQYIRRLLRKLQDIIEERKQFCMTHQIEDFLMYQRRRSENPDLPELPAVVLVIDKFTEFRQVYDKEMDLLISLARHGSTYGVYLVLTMGRPVGIPMQLMSLIEIRVGLRLVEATDSLILLGKGDAATLDSASPGRGYIRNKILQEVHIALPTLGEDDDEQTRQLDEMVEAYALAVATVNGNSAKAGFAPAIRLLPELVQADDFLQDALSNTGTAESQALSLHFGIEDFSLRPFALELNADTPHALVGGGSGSGRTGVLHTCLLMLAATEAYRHARVILVDFRRTSRLLRRLPNVWVYADTEERLVEAIKALKAEMSERLVRLREELERQQDSDDELLECAFSPVLLVIDDYDQLSILTNNPLNDLREILLQARDLGLHIIVAGTPVDFTRSDLLLRQVRACRMGIVLGSDPTDQPLLGVRMSDLPPGRGYLVRSKLRYMVQVAHLAPGTMLPWVKRLTPAPTPMLASKM